MGQKKIIFLVGENNPVFSNLLTRGTSSSISLDAEHIETLLTSEDHTKLERFEKDSAEWKKAKQDAIERAFIRLLLDSNQTELILIHKPDFSDDLCDIFHARGVTWECEEMVINVITENATTEREEYVSKTIIFVSGLAIDPLKSLIAAGTDRLKVIGEAPQRSDSAREDLPAPTLSAQQRDSQLLSSLTDSTEVVIINATTMPSDDVSIYKRFGLAKGTVIKVSSTEVFSKKKNGFGFFPKRRS